HQRYQGRKAQPQQAAPANAGSAGMCLGRRPGTIAHLGPVRPGAPYPLQRDIEASQPDRDKGFVNPSVTLQRVVNPFRLGLDVGLAPIIAAAGADAVAGQGGQQSRFAPGAKLGQAGLSSAREHRFQQLAFGGGIWGAFFHDRGRKISPPSYRADLNADQGPNEKPFIAAVSFAAWREPKNRCASTRLQELRHDGAAQAMDL